MKEDVFEGWPKRWSLDNDDTSSPLIDLDTSHSTNTTLPRPTIVDIIRGRGLLLDLQSEMDVVNARYPVLDSSPFLGSCYSSTRYKYPHVDVSGQAAMRVLQQTSENMRLLQPLDALVKRSDRFAQGRARRAAEWVEEFGAWKGKPVALEEEPMPRREAPIAREKEPMVWEEAPVPPERQESVAQPAPAPRSRLPRPSPRPNRAPVVVDNAVVKMEEQPVFVLVPYRIPEDALEIERLVGALNGSCA